MSRQDRSTAVRRVLLVLVMSVGLIAAAASAFPAGAAARKPLRTVVFHSNGHKYVLKIWAERKHEKCLPHAYGSPVRHFLRHHKCRDLTRYLVTTRVNGRGVGLAQSSLGFTGKTATQMYRAAGKFRKLVSENGTGNFYSLFHDGASLPRGPQSVPDPDAFNAQAQDAGVTIVDAWWLHGPTPRNAKPLERMARDIYLHWS
jgi:hypothetical protein